MIKTELLKLLMKVDSQVVEPVVEEPVIDEAVVEEPVAQEPVVDQVIKELVVEEPVVEEPVVEEPVDKLEEEPVMITLGKLKDSLKQQIPKKNTLPPTVEPYNKCIIVLRLKI